MFGGLGLFDPGDPGTDPSGGLPDPGAGLPDFTCPDGTVVGYPYDCTGHIGSPPATQPGGGGGGPSAAPPTSGGGINWGQIIGNLINQGPAIARAATGQPGTGGLVFNPATGTYGYPGAASFAPISASASISPTLLLILFGLGAILLLKK